MNETELKKAFPNAGRDFIIANADDYRDHLTVSHPKPQRQTADALDKEKQGEIEIVGLIKVSIRSYGKRPLDPDNLYVKDIIDGLRKAELIPDDTPWAISLECSQVKVSSGAKEKTVVRITYP